MRARYEVIGSQISPFVRKVRVAMALKGIAYDFVSLSVFSPPDWFAKISPLRRIPVLRDRERGGAVLPDSSAIVAYLDAAYPEPALLPQDPWERARALWFEEYMDTDFAYRMGMGVFRPRVVHPMLGLPRDEALAQRILSEHAPRFYGYLDGALDGRSFLAGDQLSLADIACATQFAGLRHAEETPDPSLYPRLAAFVARVLAHPVFEALAGEERALIARETR